MWQIIYQGTYRILHKYMYACPLVMQGFWDIKGFHKSTNSFILEDIKFIEGSKILAHLFSLCTSSI